MLKISLPEIIRPGRTLEEDKSAELCGPEKCSWEACLFSPSFPFATPITGHQAEGFFTPTLMERSTLL
jgi:hypothetical protein